MYDNVKAYLRHDLVLNMFHLHPNSDPCSVFPVTCSGIWRITVHFNGGKKKILCVTNSIFLFLRACVRALLQPRLIYMCRKSLTVPLPGTINTQAFGSAFSASLPDYCAFLLSYFLKNGDLTHGCPSFLLDLSGSDIKRCSGAAVQLGITSKT